MSYTVYKHTTPSNKVYIGITGQNPVKRWGGQGQGYYNQVFYSAIDKYGWNNIKHEILFSGLTKKEAEQKEMELVSKYKSTNPRYGYNISVGGYATRLGREVSMITRQKISLANKGKKSWNDGKHLTQETREKIRAKAMGRTPWNKGVSRTDEDKKKIGLGRKGIANHYKGVPRAAAIKQKASQTLLALKRGNPVRCLETNKVYYNSLEAERQTNIDHSRILKCCRGKKGYKTAGKKHWQFVV